jgi:hypothetical protein
MNAIDINKLLDTEKIPELQDVPILLVSKLLYAQPCLSQQTPWTSPLGLLLDIPEQNSTYSLVES